MSRYLLSAQGGTSRPSSDEEKVGAMRALIEAQHPSAKDLDEATIRRFLQARNLDVKKASSMLLNYLKWRKEFVPNGCFCAEEVVGSGLCSNELFLQGCDKIGRPIVVVLAGHHKPITNVEDYKRYVTYAIDKICSRTIACGQEKFVVILDLKGYGFGNNDTRAFIAGLIASSRLLPREAGEDVFRACPSNIHGCVEDDFPFYRQKHQEKDCIPREQENEIDDTPRY